MKKISYLELSSLFIILLINFQAGTNLYIIKEDAGLNSWIVILLSYILGVIPLSLTLFISNYKEKLNIYEKTKKLYDSFLGSIINTLIIIILFIIGLTILFNISSFITTQFLYHTPIIISAIFLTIISTYCANKEINVISHVSLLLMIINIIIFIISSLSITQYIKLDNLLPLLKIDLNKIIVSTIKLTIINIIPILSILIIPKDSLTNSKIYNKTIILSYIFACFISTFMTISTISILGIDLVKLFEFPEYMVLKKIKLFGFLERIENIASMMWITEAYIYITLITYNISKCITKKKQNLKRTNIIISFLLIIIIKYIFKNTTIYTEFIKNIFPYIVSLLIIPYILLTIKIHRNKCKE